jgi:hypothetical protein
MNKKPLINVEIKDEQIVLSLNIKTVKNFLRELLTEISPVQNPNKVVEESHSKRDVESPLISTLENFLEQYQNGSVVNRARYSTFKGTVGEAKGKSALYFHLVHGSTLCLSVHNSIINKALTRVFYVDTELEELKELEVFIPDPVEFDFAAEQFSGINIEALNEFNKGRSRDSDGYEHFSPYISEQARIDADARELFLLPTNNIKILKDAQRKIAGDLDVAYEFYANQAQGNYESLSIEDMILSDRDLVISFGEYLLKSCFIYEIPDEPAKQLWEGVNYKNFFEQLLPEIAMMSDSDNRFFGTKRLKFESVPELRFFLESIAEELAKFLAEPEMPNLIF